MGNNSPSSKKNRTGLAVGIVVGVGFLSFVAILMIYYIVRRRKKSNTNDNEG